MPLKSDILPAHGTALALLFAFSEFGQFDFRELLYSSRKLIALLLCFSMRIDICVWRLICSVIACVLRVFLYRFPDILNSLYSLLPGILQHLAGIIYGFARGFDPGGTVFDMQMNVLKLQCAGECIEITGDAFDVGNGMR